MIGKLSTLLAMSAVLFASRAQADLNISKKPTQNMSCSGGLCTATAKNAILNVDDLTDMLATGDLTVKFGGGALAIQISDGFSWTSTSRLTLDANTSIGVHKPVIVAGNGALTIAYDDGGSGGDLKFADKGKIDFWNLKSKLTINGNSYTLAGDIQALAQNIKMNRSGFHALANDYDATNDGTYDESAIPGAIQGVFEGLGHTIANLVLGQLSCAGHLGFFDTVATGAAVRDIALSDAFGVACGGYHSSLFVATNMGIIDGVSVSGTLQSSGPGGVAMTGAVAAANFGAVVERSSSSATVICNNKHSAAGGLVGWSDGQILSSHATGDVTAGNTALVGGLAGYAQSIDGSFATGPVNIAKKSSAGGLVGSGSATNSYALGAVHGGAESFVGGLMGQGTNTSAAYSTGAVGGTSGVTLGGFVGAYDGNFDSDVWDITTSGQNSGCGSGSCSGIAGVTDAQLKSELPNGFDPKIWAQSSNINNGYPYLRANPPK